MKSYASPPAVAPPSTAGGPSLPVLEIRDPALADRLAGFIDEVRGGYPGAETPEQSRDITSSAPSATSA